MSDEQRLQDRLLDQRVVGALERTPDVADLIPADFAARVARQVPQRKAVSVTPTYYGRSVMVICSVVLLAGLIALSASGPQLSTMGMALEWCLFAQFLVLAIWLGTRRRGEG